MKIFRRLFLLLCFAFAANTMYSQQEDTYSPFRITHFKEGGFSVYYSGYAIAPTLSYWFRMNFYEYNEFVSVSASAPLSISAYFSSYSGGFLALDLPLTADINFGNRANDETDFPIGGFVGAGGAFNLMYAWGASRSYGPLLHTGLRTTAGGKDLTLRFSYLFGIDGTSDSSPATDTNPGVWGVGVFYGL
ncbi:MAG: hypothetical protein ACKOXB_11295 [Flavobacteriales bacterium]